MLFIIYFFKTNFIVYFYFMDFHLITQLSLLNLSCLHTPLTHLILFGKINGHHLMSFYSSIFNLFAYWNCHSVIKYFEQYEAEIVLIID